MARVVSNGRVCSEYSVTKMSLFMANYEIELRMEADIRRKEKTMKFAERIKKVQKKAGMVLRKA